MSRSSFGPLGTRRYSCGPIILIQALTETCVSCTPSDQWNKEFKSENNPVSFLKKKTHSRLVKDQCRGREVGIFSLHNFSDKTKRFLHHLYDKLYPYRWKFCKFSINQVHFQSLSLMFHSIYPVGEVKAIWAC